MGAGSFGQPWAAPALGKSRSTPPARCVASGWRGGDRESTTVCLHRLERQLSWGGVLWMCCLESLARFQAARLFFWQAVERREMCQAARARGGGQAVLVCSGWGRLP